MGEKAAAAVRAAPARFLAEASLGSSPERSLAAIDEQAAVATSRWHERPGGPTHALDYVRAHPRILTLESP